MGKHSRDAVRVTTTLKCQHQAHQHQAHQHQANQHQANLEHIVEPNGAKVAWRMRRALQNPIEHAQRPLFGLSEGRKNA